MDWDLTITLAAAVLAVVLFILEIRPAGQVAMLVLGVLVLGGAVSPSEAFSGFSSPATITVGAMFVLSAGIYRSGALDWFGGWLERLLERSPRRALVALCTGTAVASAFINNTAVVAVLLPVILRSSRSEVSASKLLIPLSFASMLGGVTTLIGSSTNLVVSSVARAEGEEPLGLFEMTPLGLVFVAVGLTFLFTVGGRLIPARRSGGSLADSFEVTAYVTDVRIGESRSIGQRIQRSALLRGLDVEVLGVYRARRGMLSPRRLRLERGDVLRVRSDLSTLTRLLERDEVEVTALPGRQRSDLATDDAVLLEAVVGIGSTLHGRRLDDVELDERYEARVLAVRQRGALVRKRLGELVLRAGDALLLLIAQDRVEALRARGDFVVASPVERMAPRRKLLPVCVGIVAAVVGAAALELVPIAVSATVGALVMLLVGGVRQDEAIEAIDWNVIFLLAGILPLGVAMDTSGAAALLSGLLLGGLGDIGPAAVVSAMFLVATLLTSVISNNGAAALLTPMAIAAADTLGADPRAFLMAVAFGASTSFLTPIGYQTNTLVYGAGHYRFADFVRSGAPLSFVLWIVASLLLPVLWPP